jgi:predicted nucleotidyltransferase
LFGEEGLIIMLDLEEIKPKIIDSLKPLKPNKIILFGSYAYGTPNEDSDLDLYIVTNDEFMPKNFNEKMGIKLKVSKALEEITKVIDLDIITHTKAMHKKFLEMDSMFSRKIFRDGKVLL